MTYKIRKATTKKNAAKKKTRYSVHTRTTRLLSRVRRLIFPPSSQPLCITISTEGLTQEQIDLLKELERKGLIPRITWITSAPNSINDKMKYALLYLHSDEAKSLECKMQRGYDYAWIKMALDKGTIPSPYSILKHMSTPSFVKYIKKLGFTDIAGSKTLNKFLAKAHWYSNDNRISFPGIYISLSECERRNKIKSKFLELLNEI
jgi:hypothetical protein